MRTFVIIVVIALYFLAPSFSIVHAEQMDDMQGAHNMNEMDEIKTCGATSCNAVGVVCETHCIFAANDFKQFYFSLPLLNTFLFVAMVFAFLTILPLVSERFYEPVYVYSNRRRHLSVEKKE